MTTYIEQRIAEAETDGPVHEFQSGDNLQQETPEVPLESNFVEVKGGKYYRMWHAEDLDERLIQVNLMNSVLKQRFPTTRKDLRHARPGDKVFVFEQPKARPPELMNRCRLHPKDPARPEWDAMGLPTCSKPLANPYEVDRHMQKKHSTAWGAIERDRLHKERQEDRAAQRAMMKAITKETLDDPSFTDIIDKDIKVVQTWKAAEGGLAQDSEIVPTRRVTVECGQCDFRTWSTTKTKANNKLKKHTEAEHGSS